MTNEDVWATIKHIREDVGITYTNFRKMKANQALPEKWVTPVFLAIQGTEKEIPLERLYELSQ